MPRPLAVALLFTVLAAAGCSLNDKSKSTGTQPQISAKSTDKSAATELGFRPLLLEQVQLLAHSHGGKI